MERLKGASVAVCGASGDTVLTERTLWQARETLRECGRTAGRTQLLLDQGRLILLMPGYEGKKEEERLVEAFRRTMSAKGCCPLKIGVCRNESAARPLPETYQNACYALRFCIFYGTGPCLFYRQSLRDQAVDLWSVKEAVTAGMAEGRTEAVPGLIRDAIDAMTAGRTGLERFVHECLELLYCCVDALDPLLRTRVKQTILETENPFGVISGFTHVEEARTYLLGIFGKIADLCREDVNRDYHYKIAKAQDYILKHYQESITLQQLADLVEMSPTYFSALFKKTVGVTYLQYLAEVRMEQARRRLLAGEKVTKISEEVGYYNYRHFSEAFKRHVGMTPREFRNNRKNTDNI